MKLQGVSFVAILLLSACLSQVAAEPFRPAELLRALHRVQDEIARGDISALDLQKLLTSQLTTILENPLENRKPEPSWSSVVIGFALDGGNPKVARRMLAKISPDDPHYGLAQAISEFVNGNMTLAAKMFDSVDVVKVDPRLAPYVAIAVGTANLELEQAKAIKAFELAANLAPGTLVEEVSLRRLALLYKKTNKKALFERTINLYVRRYSKSPFAGQLLAHFAASIPTMLDLTQSRNLLAILSIKLDKKVLPLFLDIAEHSATAGKIELVDHISETYLDAANFENQALLARKKLYRLIAEPVSQYSAALLGQALQIEAKILSPSERILLSKLQNAIRQVLDPLGSAEIGTLGVYELEPDESGRKTSRNQSIDKGLSTETIGKLAKENDLLVAEIDQNIADAILRLKEVDQLLAGADK